MTPDDAREVLYAAVEAAVQQLAPVPLVQWDNRNFVDLETQVDPWVGVEFLITDKQHSGLGNPRFDRYYGHLVVMACVKQGSGIATPLKMVDSICRAVEARNFPTLSTGVGRPQRPALNKGWHIVTVAVPFDFQDIVSV